MKNTQNKFILLLAFFVFAAPLASWAQQKGFNEVAFDTGKVRPIYESIYPAWLQRFANNEKKFLADSRVAFEGDNALDPVPRLIYSQEYETLKKGVEQRAKAIRTFLKDYYSGRKYYAERGVIPDEVVQRIVARNGEAGYEGLVSPQSISFFYGPDIIRDSTGDWRVIEDNTGFIGGIGDLKLAQDYMKKAYPEIDQNFKYHSAMEFYEKVADNFKQRAAARGGKAIMYTIKEYSPDNEDARIEKIFSFLGIETVDLNSTKKISIQPDGVYLKSKGPAGQDIMEKVGYIFLNGEHAWIDPSHPAAKQKNLIDEANAYLKTTAKRNSWIRSKIVDIMNQVDPVTQLPDLKKLDETMRQTGYSVDREIVQKNHGLLDVILKNKVGSNYSPGVDFVGDKEFYVYVEDLIRLYLMEEPIIKNISTQKFSGASRTETNEVLMKTVFENLSQYVIKKVDGRGGDSVWVGPKITKAQVPDLQKLIRSNPDLYIVQKFTPLSTINKNIVDVRVISEVSTNQITVSDTPWGRGLPADGNGKVNLSEEGREVAVLVVQPLRGPERGLTCKKIYSH